jgi:hypothetical protein
MFESLRSLYDTRTASDAGEWVELFAPGTIEPATDPDRRAARAAQLAPDGKLKNEQLWTIQAEGLAPLVLEWDGFDEPFSEDAVARLFTMFRFWYAQAYNWSSARVNFSPKTGQAGSGPSSPAPSEG